MATPVSASINQINAEVFIQEGFELSLDAIVPSIELTGSFSTTKSKTQFYIYNYAKTILYENLDYQADGSYLPPDGAITSSDSIYNQFQLNPIEDVFNQGYSSGNYYALYNFIDFELGSELNEVQTDTFDGHPYFLKDVSGDRTELRIANNFLSNSQIESYYQQFFEKINDRDNADEFYISFGNNRNFIAVNSQLEVPQTGSTNGTTILIKLYSPLPSEFQIDQELQIITKVGETQVFSIDFQPNLEFIDNLLSLKGPNYNIPIKDRVNNSTNYKNLKDLVNTNSSASFYQFNSLQDQKGVIIRKNYGEWDQFVKYSSAEQRLRNFKDKLASIESQSAEIASLETITGGTTGSRDYSSSYNNISNNINNIISKFDSYEYFLYYVTGSESWPKYTETYPYENFSVTSSEALNWFGSTNESSAYYNTGKNQIYSASRYDNDNQDYLYYLIPPFITDNSNNNQYIKFISMVGQTFDEAYLYTEAVEQIRNTNSSLTGSVLPLGLADEVIESLGFEVGGNNFNSIGFNLNTIDTYPAAGSGLEFISRYVDIASGSVINYYDQQQSTLGYVIALADPSFPYPIENAAQEIYKRIFHNMVSLVKRKGTVTGLRQLINIWGVPNTMLRISEFGGKNKDDENDYDLWMNRYSTAFNTFATPATASIPNTGRYPTVNANAMFPWLPLAANASAPSAGSTGVELPDCIQFRFKTAREATAITNFSESLLLKRGADPTFDDEDNNGDFGIFLHQSGSQSGSFDGASTPHFNTYASMSFVISGSLTQGAQEARNIGGTNFANVYITDPIYLPFYNKEWWTVQIQRKTHISASGQNNTINEFELRVGQNIYNGYDGNEVGWLASSSLTMSAGVASASMNEAWNRFFLDPNPGSTKQIHNYHGSQVFLPGNIFPNAVYTANNTVGKANSKTIPGFDLGDTMSGSFQEFRYYRRALSASSFNDLVMNPESIQGHSDSNTGPGSSYDLLSYRVPLGNELEFTEPNGSASYFDATYVTNLRQFSFGGLQPTGPLDSNLVSGSSTVGSVHPAVVNYTGSYGIGVGNPGLYTSSFFNKPSPTTTSPFFNPYFLNFRFNDTPELTVTSSYVVPNNSLNYMDQPSAGIRNRIKNKIQVIDGNEFGTTLSPFRSIQQEFEQSSSYTEDINSLEVGFSFQNEINDDIISTFGHGVVSDAIADPRNISESGDRYPELTRIAEDYFKKYQGYPVITPLFTKYQDPKIIEKEYDYNRLIKFYESSLFKAIKNYVPARTSLSTGIIVKQHLLERNKTNTEIGININTVIATTPINEDEGSNVKGYNNRIVKKNLLITSSIGMQSLTGSAGGSVNKYNILRGTTGSKINMGRSLTFTTEGRNITNFYDDFGADEGYFQTNGDFFQGPQIPNEASSALTASQFFTVLRPLDVQYRFKASSIDSDTHILTISGSKRGILFEKEFDGTVSSDVDFTSPVLTLMPEERYQVWVRDTSGTDSVQFITSSFNAYNLTNTGPTSGGGIIGNPGFSNPTPPLSSSQQAWFYVDNFTGENKIKNTQDEFYNGEYSGSSIDPLPAQYNPYRIFADGNDQTPDTLPTPSFDLNNAVTSKVSTGLTSTGLTLSSVSTAGITITTDAAVSTGTYFIVGAFENLVPGIAYTVSGSVTALTNLPQVGPALQGADSTGFIASATALSGSERVASLRQFEITFTATNFGSAPGVIQPFTSGPGSGFDNGGFSAFFLASSQPQSATFELHSISIVGGLGGKHLQPNDGFTIIPSQSQLFQNSFYNPLINNVSSSRKNSYLFDMDFDPVTSGSTKIQGIPSDYPLLVSASQLGWEPANRGTTTPLLEFAEVPDSNYTALSVINPRYNGSLLESADYNFYTGIPSASVATGLSPTQGFTSLANLPELLAIHKVRYVNGETGSWGGDVSYGKTAVIDKNPINIAHFKQSFSSPSVFNTTTFILDQLIQIPFNDILNEQSPIITSSLLNGSNENLIPVSSTFEKNRRASVFFNSQTKTFRAFNLTLNYATLANGSHNIFAPANDFQAYFSNQFTNINTTISHSWFRPTWALRSNQFQQFQIGSSKGGGVMNDDQIPNVPLQSDLELKQMTSASAINIFTTGSSDYARSKGLGILTLLGPNQSSVTPRAILSNGSFTSNFSLIGPLYALFNTLNINTRRGDASVNANFATENGVPGVTYPALQTTVGFASTITSLGTGSNFGSIAFVPQTNGLKTANSSPSVGDTTLPVIQDKENLDNYYRFNFSQSLLSEYEQNDKSFEIKVGDEIRVSYRFPSQNAATQDINDINENFETITQDFRVIEYEIAPPALMTEAFGIPGGGSTFNFDIPGLITSSAPEFNGYATQIDEYTRRLDIAMQNKSCFYLMNAGAGNATLDGCGSGSFIANVQQTNFVTNLDGESRPTTVTVTVQRSNFRTPQTTTSANWIFGTNMSGVDDYAGITAGGTGSLVMPRKYGGSGFNFQRKLFITDGEDQTQALAFDAGFVWNRLLVDPDPVALVKPIPSGSILAATIRRRTEDDSRVVLDLSPPSGSRGITTPSGDGYLIPNDLTSTQQANVQKIINKLQSENVFDNPDKNEEV